MDACDLSADLYRHYVGKNVLNFSGRIMVIRTGLTSKSGRGERIMNTISGSKSHIDAAAGFPEAVYDALSARYATVSLPRSFKDYFFQTTDGLRLFARDYPDPGTLTISVLLCLHGLTRNSKDFASVVDASDFRVVVPEQRGRGLSDYSEDVSELLAEAVCGGQWGASLRTGLQRLSVWVLRGRADDLCAECAPIPGLIERAVINDIGPEIAQAGLDRIKSMGAAGLFEDWEEATAYLSSITAEIFPDWTDAQWSDFARQCYIKREGQIVIDYDPRIATPLATQSSAKPRHCGRCLRRWHRCAPFAAS